MSPKQVDTLRELHLEFHDRFALSEPELSEVMRVFHHVDAGEHPPHAERLRQFPTVLEDEIDKEVQGWCDFRVDEPSDSVWITDVVPVREPLSKEIRLYLDWKLLNLRKPKDKYPLPSCLRHVDDAGAKGAEISSTLDLRSSYLQTFLDEESMDKTQFITRKGIFRMGRRGFGLCKAPATFRRMMDVLLAPFFPDKIWAYLDDMTELFEGDLKCIVWTLVFQTSFLLLKQALSEAPALAYLDRSRLFTMETDRNEIGFAAVLEQRSVEYGKLQPVVCASRTVGGPEVRDGSADLELLAVNCGFKHSRVYIYGRLVTVIMDHQVLVAILRNKEELVSERQMRWEAFILDHVVELVYRTLAVCRI